MLSFIPHIILLSHWFSFVRSLDSITAAHIIGIFVITIICYFFSTITGVDILPVDNANSTDEFKKITFSQIASWLATPAILFQLLWSGIASIVIGIYLESLAMKTLTASESVVIFSTEPIFAVSYYALVRLTKFCIPFFSNTFYYMIHPISRRLHLGFAENYFLAVPLLALSVRSPLLLVVLSAS